MAVDRTIASLDGTEALPRKNGELVFQAPWEGRAFGLAVVLNEKAPTGGMPFEPPSWSESPAATRTAMKTGSTP